MKTVRPQYTPPKKAEEKTKAELLDEMTALSRECGLYEDKQYKIDETTNIAIPTVPNVEVESIDKQGNKWVVYDEVGKYPLVLPKQDEPLVDDTTTPVQYIMDNVIADKDRIINKKPVTMGNYVRFEITLTKRQYELWQKKGGEAWLKKKLVGQTIKKGGKNVKHR